MILCCFCLAVLIHPDLNNRPLFDSVWTAALYVDGTCYLLIMSDLNADFQLVYFLRLNPNWMLNH